MNMGATLSADAAWGCYCAILSLGPPSGISRSRSLCAAWVLVVSLPSLLFCSARTAGLVVIMRRASTRGSKSAENAADVASGAEVAADAVKRKRSRQSKKGPRSSADRHAELDEHVSCTM